MTWTVLDVEDHWLVCYFYPLSTLITEKCQRWLFCLSSLSPALSDYEAWVVWRCWLGIAERIVYKFMAFWIGRPPAPRHTNPCKHAHTNPQPHVICIPCSHPFTAKPISILKSPCLCSGHEYSSSVLHGCTPASGGDQTVCRRKSDDGNKIHLCICGLQRKTQAIFLGTLWYTIISNIAWHKYTIHAI